MNVEFEQLSIFAYQHIIAITFFIYCSVIGFALSLKLNLFLLSAKHSANYDVADSINPSLFQVKGSPTNIYLILFFSLCLGLGVVIISMFILGLLDAFQKTSVLLMMLLWFVFALSGFAFDKQIKTGWNSIRCNWSVKAFLQVEFYAVILLLLATMIAYIIVPGKWDDTSYHLPIAASYVKNGGFFLNEYLRFPLAAQNINLLFVWALLFDNHLLAQAMATLPLFISCLGLLGASVWLTRLPWVGFFSSVGFLMSGPVLGYLGYAYIDNGFGLFCWAAILAVALASEKSPRDNSFSIAWIFVAGFVSGIALGAKYFAIPLLGLLVLWLLWKRMWRAAYFFSVVTLVVGCGWYLRSFLISGDPIHPVGAQWFGYFLWSEVDLQNQMEQIRGLAVGRDIGSVFASLFHIHAYLLVLAFAPLILIRKLPDALRLMLLVWVGYFLFWFLFAQVERYLAPVLAVGSFLAGYFLYWTMLSVLGKWFYRLPSQLLGGLCCLVCFALATIFYFGLLQYLGAKTNIRNAHAILNGQAYGGYELYSKANSLIPKLGERLLQLGFEQGVYFYKGTAMGDWFGPARYSQFNVIENGQSVLIPADQLKAKMLALNTRVVMINMLRISAAYSDSYAALFNLEAETQSGLLLSLKETD